MMAILTLTQQPTHVLSHKATLCDKAILSHFCFQVIEIPRGSKVKYELDKKTGLVKVKIHVSLIFFCTCSFPKLMFPFSVPCNMLR